MTYLHDMIARTAQPGRITWIGLRPARRAAMQAVAEAWLDKGGLDGDRARAGKRALTVLQAEHLAAIGSYLGRAPVNPADLRRNLVVSGLNLAGSKGRRMRLGTAIVEITVICAPCSRMEETFGHGGYGAVRGHGGWCAQVISAGPVCLGDPVTYLSETRGR
ncbi:MAG: MOSC domain-containing protein [Pseudomonadota bacterium]